jgi:maltose 6'-phosphate phosphatase
MVNLLKYKILCIMLLLFLPGGSMGGEVQSVCSDIQQRGFFSVLTVNLLYAENKDRVKRFQTLADFIQQKTAQGEPVDVILLQEVVGGFLSGTQNSSRDLKDLLAGNGLIYNLRYCPVNDQIGILSEGIAMLSRCRFVFTAAKTLVTVWETPSEGFEIPLRRRAMMGRIHIPGVGRINVFNTHLCAYCEPADRFTQNKALLKFVSDVGRLIFWDKTPVILGGDFNVDLVTPGGREIHDTILDIGFEDTYAAVNLCGSCCSVQEGYEGCTFGVPANPYTDDMPVRIDYIFTRDLQVLESSVVFKASPDWVSDHSAVLTKIAIP